MLPTLSFKTKITLLMATAMGGLVALGAVASVQLRSQIFEARKNQLLTVVQSADAIVEGYRKKAEKGELTIEAAKAAATDAVRQIRYGATNTDYIYIWNADGTGVMHPFKPEWTGQPMLGKIKEASGQDVLGAMLAGSKGSPTGNAFVDTRFPRPGSTEEVPKLQYVMAVPAWNWVLGSGLYMDDVAAQVNTVLLTNLAVAIAIIIGVGGFGVVIARSVLRQIGGEPGEVVVAMRLVAGGKLSVDPHAAIPGSVMAELHAMVDSLRATVSAVRGSTDSIATASAEISAGSTDLSSRTEQNASSLQETAATMEQLTTTVHQTSESAKNANALVTAASASASQGGAVVNEVVQTMDLITQSSKRIGDIVGVIDGIAFQTNILALNAAVEAARAGEQGRGFAVVASEVRSLAQRSASAAKEIKALIDESVARVHSGAAQVGRAGESMAAIVESVRRVSSIIDEIHEATSEQSSGIRQVNTAVAELDRATQQNAALVEESAAAAESLRDQARRLVSTVQIFDLEH